ncbi:MAG TPA: hypothetical protein VFF73_24370 [Planctomycetota bacterium]|nr:hypothetical protein [Planctomycetota bacterium]
MTLSNWILGISLVVAAGGAVHAEDWKEKAGNALAPRDMEPYSWGSWAQGLMLSGGSSRGASAVYTVKDDPQHVIVVPNEEFRYLVFQDPAQKRELAESKRVFDVLEQNGVPVVDWTTGTFDGRPAALVPKDFMSVTSPDGPGFAHLDQTSIDEAVAIKKKLAEARLPIHVKGFAVDGQGHIMVSDAFDTTRERDGAPKKPDDDLSGGLPPPDPALVRRIAFYDIDEFISRARKVIKQNQAAKLPDLADKLPEPVRLPSLKAPEDDVKAPEGNGFLKPLDKIGDDR